MSKTPKTGTRTVLFEGQHEDEDLLLVFRSHPVQLRRPLIAFLLIILLTYLPVAVWPLSRTAWSVAGGGLIVGILVFFYYWIGWYYSLYMVTDERLIEIKQKGLFNRKVVELGLDKIQNINYEVKGIQESLLNFGTIVVQTFVGDLVLTQIAHPVETHRQLTKILRMTGQVMGGKGEGNDKAADNETTE